MVAAQRYLIKNSGFTLIELIIVIILLGILATTAMPKFFNSQGFEEYTYRNEVITTLRAIQLRAMQNTSDESCHQIKITSTMLGLTATDASDSAGNYCDESTWFDATDIAAGNDGALTVEIDDAHSVSFAIVGASADYFSFDSLGRTVDCPSDPCDITVTGDSSLTIRISDEGYIYVP